MNRNLKYILIFVICFAAAMLLGRLFKSTPADTQEQTIPADTTHKDSLDTSL